MKVKKFQNILDESEFNAYQVLVSELDTTLDRLRVISLADLSDAYEVQSFNRFWDSVTQGESVVVSINDDTDLYEWGDDNTLLVLSKNLNDRMIIFDKQDKVKIVNAIEK